MEIILVRHGDEIEGYRGGWSNISLSEVGIEKTHKLAKYMYENIEEYKVTKIISSDLNRAKMTAEILSEKLNANLVLDERLRENNNGLLAGMKHEDANKMFPGIFFNTLEFEQKFPGGESAKEFYERIEKSFYQIIKENKNEDRIIIVTHGGVASIILHMILDIPWSNKEIKYKIKNTEIVKIRIESGKYFVERIGLPHLEG